MGGSVLRCGRRAARKAGTGPCPPARVVRQRKQTHCGEFYQRESRCSVGHTAKGYIAGVRQGAFPKEVTVKSKSE